MPTPSSKPFDLVSPFSPTGDQPAAIEALTRGVEAGMPHQTLLGVTGSGKTYTMANVIARTGRPTLVLAHNKTLAAQLASEFRQFFPNNAVHYFVSYYDYYQPEAYIARTDTYIEKETDINEEIDRLRHACTHALLTRRDVIIVASVSCIYGIGTRQDYSDAVVHIRVGQTIKRTQLQRELTGLQFVRNDVAPTRGQYRVAGDVIDIYPAYGKELMRVHFFGDEIEKIEELDPLTFHPVPEAERLVTSGEALLFPAKLYVTTQEKMKAALGQIREDMEAQVKLFEKNNQLIEAQRIKQRVNFDLEMLEATGFVNGIENYSRYFDGRKVGEPPATLVDYFPEDFLMVVDESHMTLPQVRGMYNGDRARKETLVNYGFRLPAALDNRPLKFEELMSRVKQLVYVSATPKPYELELSRAEGQVAEQLIRPTGLIDPTIEIRPSENQIDHLLTEIRARIIKGERALVTTMTKAMAEELAEYIGDAGIKVHYLHSEIETFERLEILRDLRMGTVDVVVGINLLREGLDLPEVSLVAILDADKESFLRDETSLIQTMGRAARHVHGHVIMYADRITRSMSAAIAETERRRKIQTEYNATHGITPRSITREMSDDRLGGQRKDEKLAAEEIMSLPASEIKRLITELEQKMELAAKNLEFEEAARLRDEIGTLRKQRTEKNKKKGGVIDK
jgi:excinuclease ABC subunit B